MASKNEQTTSKVVRGRPRSLPARRAVLDATRALVEKGGYSAASIEAIAARSGVAKTTIYRWWPNRAALVVDLLLELADAAAPPPAAGDPMRELRCELRRVAEASEALPGKLLISLLGEAERDPDIRAALVSGLFTPRRKATANAIRRAQLSGALRGDIPPFIATDLLYGPLFYRKYIRNESVAGPFVQQVMKYVLDGLLAPSQAERAPLGANAAAAEGRAVNPRRTTTGTRR